MKAQDYKDIKIANADTVKVMTNNEVWWEKNSLLKPDYEFYDSEIGKNSNWSKHKLGYWYLNKFEGQYVVYVRYYELQNKNKLHKLVGGQAISMPVMDTTNGYSFFHYSEATYLMGKSEMWLFPTYEDNTYKTYVFKCTNEYSEKFEKQLENFANSL